MIQFVLLLMFRVVFSQNLSTSINFTRNGRTVAVQGIHGPNGSSFLGIPFAQPPLGNFRFKEAQPIQLSGFYDARQQKSKCVQTGGMGPPGGGQKPPEDGGQLNGNMAGGDPIGIAGPPPSGSPNESEDCLYLNVFTPSNVTPSSRLPVFLFIHGGAFVSGEGFFPSGGKFSNLVNRGPMILVLTTYRLGPFGFLSTRNSALPGNAALTDWIAALQWIQNYIGYFGGDPEKVTIGGESAGAIAVSFLTMTRKADGLFRAAIMESGSSFLPTVMSYNSERQNISGCHERLRDIGSVGRTQYYRERGPKFPVKHAKKAARVQKIIACLRSKNTTEIVAADSVVPVPDGGKWGLVMDPVYLPERLESLALKRRQIPIMQGANSLEFLLFELGALRSNLSQFTRQYVTDYLRDAYQMSAWDNPQQVFDGAKRIYIDSVNAADNDHVQWALAHMRLWSDMMFVGSSLRDAKYSFCTGSPVFLYSLDTQPTAIAQMVPDARLVGSPHSVDLSYIFNFGWTTNQPIGQNDDQFQVKEIMGKLWTNFILFGDPTPSNTGIPLGFKWDQIGCNNAYLSITNQPRMQQNFHPASMYWVCGAPATEGRAPPYCG